MTGDIPTRAELRAHEWDTSLNPLPDWVRPPLAAERPVDHHGYPHETIRCTDHPGWQTSGDRQHVLWHARRHVIDQHQGVAV